MSAHCELCAAINPAVTRCALQEHLRPGQTRVLLANRHAAAIPTIGAFTPGYLLIVPAKHTPSLGLLPRPHLASVQALAAVAADRITRAYGTDTLAFEYGLNAPNARRIDHAHLHLLPTDADLRGHLDRQLSGHGIDSLINLPRDPGASYIAVQDQRGRLRVYPVSNDAKPRLRLREIVAALDPKVTGAWDWQHAAHPELMQRTLDELRDGAPARALALTGKA